MSLCLLVVCYLYVSACSLIEPYQAPALNLPSQYRAPAPVAASVALSTDNWWTYYRDDELNRLLALAVKQNADIKQAVARIEQADAYAKAVGAALLPTINANANVNTSRVTQTGPIPVFQGTTVNRKNHLLGLSTIFELDVWGRLKGIRDVARAQALATRYAKDTVTLSLTGLVVSHYFTLRGLQAQQAILQHSVRNAETLLRLIETRVQDGITSRIEAEQARENYHALLAQWHEQTRQISAISYQLALLTGEMTLVVSPATAQTGLPQVPTPALELPSALLSARPDIRQAEARLMATHANIGAARAALYPTFLATANIGAESKQLGKLLQSPSRVWGFDLGLDLPIFDAGLRRALVEQANAQQKEALFAYEQVVQQAFQEVNTALTDLQQHSQREIALNQAMQATQNTLLITQTRYQHGYSAYWDVLNAEQNYAANQLTHIQSQIEQLQASAQLFKALGGAWMDHENQVAHP